MLAEPHLAEDAFALHLLFQHLEGLLDIVVTDENLNAAFLLFREARYAYGEFRSRWQPWYEYRGGDSSQAGRVERLMISHEAVAEPLPSTSRFAVNTSAGEQ